MHWTSILALAGSVAAGSCPRAFLESLTSQYLAAQTAGDPSLFPSLAPNATFIENDVTLAGASHAVLTQPLVIDHNRSVHDTVQCAAFSELIVTNPKNPYVIHTRLLVSNATRHVAVVDSVVTRPGDWAFNATGYLYWDALENWAIGPYEKVATDRAALQAAADAYFNRFDNTSVVIPLGTPCARLEGGAYTGRGNLTANTCDIGGFPDDIKVTTRRYIVDEAAGVVDIFEGFPGLDRSEPTRAVPDSHLFRVVNGSIRYIHTVSHCFNAGCGMNGTLFGKRSGRW
ncbi:hypothetical protein SEUCBS139899_002515 [Sporothrix eucalyptigena]|uniref:DUF8021 domain-containing protein n=1 Tax=Sporothrix eucalyptigena TaxID=1812306 RepID=A0ABP0B4G1_9PEZI